MAEDAARHAAAAGSGHRRTARYRRPATSPRQWTAKIVATINGLNAPVLAVDLLRSMPTPAAPWAHWCVPPAPPRTIGIKRACPPPTGWTGVSHPRPGIPWE